MWVKNVALNHDYDTNGNMVYDGANNLDLTYNHLNLVEKVAQNGVTLANYSYLADGSKLSALDNDGNGLVYTGSLVYRKQNGVLSLESIPFSMGRIVATSGNAGADGGSGSAGGNGAGSGSSGDGFAVHYHMTDHLGSVRAVVDGATGQVIERNDYQPFGLRIERDDQPIDSNNRHRYNSKEVQAFLDLPYTDYGARWRDAKYGIGWNRLDDRAEDYYPISPFAFCGNNPIFYIDPNGMNIFRYDDQTGTMILAVENDDDFDQIGRFKEIKNKETGKISYELQTKKNGKAKTRIDNIEKGILSDGMNFMTDDNMWEVGSEGQPTVGGFQDFVIGFAEMINKEISGYYMNQSGTPDAVNNIYMGRHIKNTATKSYKGKVLEPNRMTLNGAYQIHTDWHTHPTYGHSEADRTKYSDPDMESKINALGSPLLSRRPSHFMILTKGYAPIYY